MSKQEMQDIKIDDITWQYLGSGSYNDAYWAVVNGQKKVYKIPKASTISTSNNYSPQQKEMDTPDRAVRLWNQINPKFPAEKYHKGWIAPFIEGKTPTAIEICHAIVDIYKRTGRVLADAMTRSNFKKTSTNKIVCVDIGAALKLEIGLEKEKSEASLNFWREMKCGYDDYFTKGSDIVRSSIAEMTKALLVLQQFRPDVRDVSRLTTDPKWVRYLAKTYINTPRMLSLKVYQVLPINLDYFSKIPFLQKIVSDQNLSNDRKRQFCQLYQLKKFGQNYNALLVLLIDKFHLNALDAIKVICDVNRCVADTLLHSSDELVKTVVALSQEGKLTKDSFNVLNALNKANILTQINFDQVRFHANLTSLAKSVFALSQGNTLLTQESFQLEVLKSQAVFYINHIMFGNNKTTVKKYVHSAIEMTGNTAVQNKEKIKILYKIEQAIIASCLKNESGVLGMGLFSTTGKTQSYQDAMRSVKELLLKILNNAEQGSIPKKDIELAKDILGEHLQRGPHIMDASSLSNIAFRKHEKYYLRARA